MAEHAYIPTIPVGEPANWRDRAACAGHNPERWFSYDRDTIADALKICSDCPVAKQCLEDTLEYPAGDDWGIRGGIEEGERRKMRRRIA